MSHFKKVTILPFCLLLFLFISCDKEEVNNNDNGFPIELTAVQDGRNVNLAWTETKVSTFAEYLVVRSVEPIPTDFVPTPFSQFVIERLDEFEDNEFVDSNPLLAEKIYYKVFVDIGGRFLQSEEVVLEYEVTILNRFTNRVEFNSNTGMMYLFNGQAGNLLAYNFRTGESLGELNVFSSQIAFQSGNNGNGEELYLLDDFSSFLKVYDAFSLELKKEFEISSNPTFVTTNNNGELYISTNSFSGNIKVVDADDGSIVDNFSSEVNSPRIFSWDGEENEIAIVGNFELEYVKFNDEGVVISSSNKSTNSFPTNNGGHGISADKEFIMPYSDGSIYDKELNLFATIGNGNAFFEDFAFSSDGTKVFAATNSFLQIQQFSWPDLELEETYQFSYALNRIFEDNGSLIVVGTINDFTGTRTVIETINY